MNEQPQFEIVELGNAKEKTRGPMGPVFEQRPTLPYRPV